jgi:hypothetical protein
MYSGFGHIIVVGSVSDLSTWLDTNSLWRTRMYVWYVQSIQSVSRLVDITAEGDFLGLCHQQSSYKHVSDFGRLRSYGHFLIPYTPTCEPRFWNQLAGDVLNLVAYRLRCKHYYYHLTRPPSYRQSSFLIWTLGRYLRNAGKVGWLGFRLASAYCMTQLLQRVQKPLSLTLQWLCRLLMFRTAAR